MPRVVRPIGVSIFIFISLLGLAEVFLRYASGIFSTYSEKSGGSGYQSPFVPLSKFRNLEYPSRGLIQDVRNEFSYTYQANELGIFDRDPEEKGDPAKLRILCLGDSFTHGVGAPQDSSWPRGLEARLRQLGVEADVINAGLQGSDPVYSMDFLENRLFDAYSPNLVLIAINSTDVYEVALRGGTERFVNDSCVKYSSAPWWEPLFASSHLVRGVIYSMGFNGYLLKNSDMTSVETESLNTIRNVITDWVAKANREGKVVRVGLVLHPLVGELKGEGDFLIKDAFEPKDEEWFIIDLHDAFEADGRLSRRTRDRFFWPIDQHHNSNGYSLFGELVANELYNWPATENGIFTDAKDRF